MTECAHPDCHNPVVLPKTRFCCDQCQIKTCNKYKRYEKQYASCQACGGALPELRRANQKHCSLCRDTVLVKGTTKPDPEEALAGINFGSCTPADRAYVQALPVLVGKQ